MKLTYSDGHQRIEIKTVYAYHYKENTQILIGKTNLEWDSKSFIKKLEHLNFKLVKTD